MFGLIKIIGGTLGSLGGHLNIVWVRVANSDTAHVHASLHLEVALVSPVGAPGVLDDPVWDSLLGSVSDSEHSVVNIHGSVLAGLGGVDTALVVTESIDNLESNGNWSLLSNGLSKLDLITLGDVHSTAWNIDDIGGGVDGASLVFSLIWVSFLSADSVWLNINVLESVGWKTTFTSVVVEISGTVYELLL